MWYLLQLICYLANISGTLSALPSLCHYTFSWSYCMRGERREALSSSSNPGRKNQLQSWPQAIKKLCILWRGQRWWQQSCKKQGKGEAAEEVDSWRNCERDALDTRNGYYVYAPQHSCPIMLYAGRICRRSQLLLFVNLSLLLLAAAAATATTQWYSMNIIIICCISFL